MYIQNRVLRAAALGRLVLFAGVALVLLARPGLAQVHGTPEIYNVTVNEFSLCADSNCASKTTVISSSSAFNLADAAPGTPAGDYVPAGTTIPSGTYSHFLISIGQAIEVVGRITNVTQNAAPGPMDCITATMAAAGTGGLMAENLTMQATGAGSPGTTTFTIPAQNGNKGGGVNMTTAGGVMAMIIPFAAPITVTDGEAMPAFEINFDVANAFGGFQTDATDCEIFLNELKITVEVGGVTLATLTFGGIS
ncbi:MAG TPA: hypothetical protein ENH05_06595 [Rhizobiales bacterium]|nr:hypothetical protein BMS3Bbin10_01609 [bacterium BMS3Bbin10]HDO52390.1 hypothetical protein [Hyphomicrobiales bacterium]